MDDPKHIGRYEILGELGKGAMGKVYRAQDPNIGRVVALKTMRIDVHGSDDVEILRRFKHEAKLAGVLNHGNIVTIYDAGEQDGVFYMAMEYLEGNTLQTLLHNHRTLSADRIVEVARQVCAGLDYAHSHNVIHRDVKPANIMITNENVVKIMDFGIAKSAADMTTTGQVLGTPTYMSPEQVRGKVLDGRSDIFSFGVVLYEMVVGEKPFTGQTITTIIYKIIHEPAIPPRELDVTVHPGISTIIMKALAKNPEERYQNGADLVRDLLNYKSVGSDTESTKMIAAAAAPGKASAGAAAIPAAPRTGMLEAAKAAIKPVIKPSAVRRPGESTVGGIRIGNKPPAKVPLPPAKVNFRIVGMVLGAVLVLALSLAAWQWKKGQPLETVAAPVQEASPAPTQNTEAVPPEKVKEESIEPEVTVKKVKPSPAAAKAAAIEPRTLPASTPAAATVDEKGSLQITSDPPGAKAIIAGATNTSGNTPFTATNLEPGNYVVTLTKQGFVPVTRNVRVIAGKAAAVGADLKSETAGSGKLVLNSTPTGAEIFIDGKSTGKVTPAQLPVSSGEHKIELRKSGYQDAETTTLVKDGANHTFAPVLEVVKAGGGNPFRRLFGGKIPEGKGMVNFKTNPSGVDIVHNGAKIDKPTPAKFPMDPGSYKVTLRKDGFKPRQYEFKVEKGKTVDIDVTLEKN
jgi:predicted Ser/Thr protein kinase